MIRKKIQSEKKKREQNKNYYLISVSDLERMKYDAALAHHKAGNITTAFKILAGNSK